MLRRFPAFLSLTLTLLCWASLAHADGVCSPPPGFQDTPHPTIASLDQLVSHTEEMIVPKSLDDVLAQDEHKSLKQAIKKADNLPGVAGTYVLTGGDFGLPGSRRLVCLTDGSTTEEQVLLRERNPTSSRFRYVVWNYTTEKARPIVYGVGEFVWTSLGKDSTNVRWTYSFQLNRNRFPGLLGPFGDWLFRVTFLDRDYAQMMRRTMGRE